MTLAGREMDDQAELTPFQRQIYSLMQEKETEELLEIWQENDYREWTASAFLAIRLVLLERLGKLPEQEAPKLDEETQFEVEKRSVETIPVDRASIGLVRIAVGCNWFSWVILIFAILVAVLRIMGGLGLLVPLENVLFAGVAFLLLQGMAAILSLLVDIRNSAGIAPGEEGQE
jgi:hypothetical protein